MALHTGRILGQINLSMKILKLLIDKTLVNCHFIFRQSNVATHTSLVCKLVSIPIRLISLPLIRMFKNCFNIILFWNTFKCLRVQPTSRTPPRQPTSARQRRHFIGLGW
jgi:hypothetical protein